MQLAIKPSSALKALVFCLALARRRVTLHKLVHLIALLGVLDFWGSWRRTSSSPSSTR